MMVAFAALSLSVASNACPHVGGPDTSGCNPKLPMLTAPDSTLQCGILMRDEAQAANVVCTHSHFLYQPGGNACWTANRSTPGMINLHSPGTLVLQTIQVSSCAAPRRVAKVDGDSAAPASPVCRAVPHSAYIDLANLSLSDSTAVPSLTMCDRPSAQTVATGHQVGLNDREEVRDYHFQLPPRPRTGR